jgi:hypothetical protein
LLQAQGSSGEQLANLSPAALASLVQAHGAGGQNLTPAALAAIIQSAGGQPGSAATPGAIQVAQLPPAQLASLIKSGQLTPEIRRQIPAHVLEAASRMSHDEIEKSLGIV